MVWPSVALQSEGGGGQLTPAPPQLSLVSTHPRTSPIDPPALTPHLSSPHLSTLPPTHSITFSHCTLPLRLSVRLSIYLTSTTQSPSASTHTSLLHTPSSNTLIRNQYYPTAYFLHFPSPLLPCMTPNVGMYGLPNTRSLTVRMKEEGRKEKRRKEAREGGKREKHR